MCPKNPTWEFHTALKPCQAPQACSFLGKKPFLGYEFPHIGSVPLTEEDQEAPEPGIPACPRSASQFPLCPRLYLIWNVQQALCLLWIPVPHSDRANCFVPQNLSMRIHPTGAGVPQKPEVLLPNFHFQAVWTMFSAGDSLRVRALQTSSWELDLRTLSTQLSKDYGNPGIQTSNHFPSP